MTVSRVAYRYAGAILDAMPEGADQEAFFSDLQDLERSIRQSRELQLFFESPVLSRTQKTGAIDALFSDRLQPYVLQSLKLLVVKGREDLILEIIEAVRQLRRERNNVRVSDVSSAVELGDAEKQALRVLLEQASGATIESNYTLDPSLKGGVVVRLGDTVFDGSVARQLQKLHRRFASGT